MNTDPSGYLTAALDQYWNLDKSITNYDRFYGFSEGGGGGGGWGGNGGVLPGWAQNSFGGGYGYTTVQLLNALWNGSTLENRWYHWTPDGHGNWNGKIGEEIPESFYNKTSDFVGAMSGLPKNTLLNESSSTKTGYPFIVGYTIHPEFQGVIIKRGEFWANLTGYGRYSNGYIYLPKNFNPNFMYGLAQHEYGHYLQELAYGKPFYDNYISPNSVIDATMGPDHPSEFWEVDANIRADNQFGTSNYYYDIHNSVLWPKKASYIRSLFGIYKF